MNAVALIQFWLGGYAIQEKWIKDDRVSRGKRRINSVEITRIIGAHVARRAHAGKQDSNVTIGELAQNCIESGFGEVGIQPSQCIICPEFDNDRVSAIRNRPIETAETAGGGISRHTRIGDRGCDAFTFQRFSQPCRKSIFHRQSETGAE